nr:hypothetical protein [Tanacetum cinerariifolium]
MSSSENDLLSLEEKSSSASKRRLEKVVKSSQASTSHSLLDKSSDLLGLGTRVSTLDFMNSFDSVSGIVSRCSFPILRESSGSTVAIAITFDLPTVEPEDSLRMGNEHLDTIPETESNEFIKSSVETLVPSPSKSEDLSNSECDVLACDDFTTFSNLLFDADDDFSSSDNKS